MMNKAQKFWDKQAKKFDATEKQFDAVYREIIAKTREYFHAEDIVLDFGCATGTKTLQLGEGIKHIHGLDFSGEMIKEAIKKKEKAHADNVSFSQGTIFSEELEKASYDKIVAYGIVHLLDDCDGVIQRIHELLKPGGLFISTTACFKDRMALKTRIEFTMFRVLRKIGIFPLHLNEFRKSDIEQLIHRRNFNIVKAERMFDRMTVEFIVAEKT